MSFFVSFMQRYWLWLTVFLWLLITGLSLWPVAALPVVPGTDKTHHFIAYSALVFPVAFVRPRYFKVIFLGLVAWGGAIELIQPFVNRWGEWFDLAANCIGAGMGLVLSMLLRKLMGLSR